MKLLSACLLATALHAQVSMVPGDPLQCFTRLDGAPRVAFATVDVEGPGFTRAWRLTTRELAPNAWDLRLRCFSTRAARQGDLGVATYWIRSTRDTSAISHFVVEQGADPYSKSAQYTTSAGREWKKIQAAFRWDRDYDGSTNGPNSYNLSFWVNLQVQELEIGGFELLNHGAEADPRTMNLAGFPYPGASADAPWRAAAQERIEKYRKGDIEIRVQDAAGNAVPGAEVQVRLKRHAFGFATAVDCGTLNTPGADNDRYRAELLRNFNRVAIENDLKWPFFETWAAGRFERAEPWLRENKLDIHAHVLVWPGSRNLPPDVQGMLAARPVNQELLRTRVNRHIEQMMNATRGQAWEWDVLNEPFDNKDIQAALGDGEMAEWFKLARQAGPGVRLFLNDYDIVERGGFYFPHLNYTLGVLQRIVEQGGPVDGFGFQSHFSGTLTDPERVYEIYEQFAAHVNTLQITEFDVTGVDEETRAQYTRDYLTIAFSHPKMNGFSVWGFWAGRHWRPEAALIARDWQPTKSLDAWRDLIFREWWTNAEGTTNDEGVYRLRGFAGQYDVTVKGQTREFTVAAAQANPLVWTLE